MHRKARTIAVTAVFAAVSLIGTSTATAATEVGNTCTGDRAEETLVTLLQIANPTNPASLAIPQAGVITKWRVGVIPYPGGISEKLKVFRPAAGSDTFTAVGESTVQPIVGGINSFDTRIPVQAGDRLGVTASPLAIFCEEISTPSDVMGALISDLPLNSTATFVERPKGQVAVSAIVEPDADGDGYGDETQDKCPQSAAAQVACPVVKLSATSTSTKGLATVLITADAQATVTVGGTVKLGKGKSVNLNGGTQIVAPGAIAKFTLLFPGKLKSKLKALPRKRFLSLNVTATAPNPIGSATTSNLTVKLKGQAKPKPKNHKVKGSKH